MPGRPPPRGSYLILIDLARPARLTAARRCWDLAAGWYLYAGSAQGGVFPRVLRHLRADKRVHWHIDRLTGAPGARVHEVLIVAGPVPGECDLLARARRAFPRAHGVGGFGAGDCRRGCGTHLLGLGPAWTEGIHQGWLGLLAAEAAAHPPSR